MDTEFVFHVLAILNSAAMNSGAHVSFQVRIFVFSRCVPRSEIAESRGGSGFSCYGAATPFPTAAVAPLASHRQCGRVPFSPHPL